MNKKDKIKIVFTLSLSLIVTLMIGLSSSNGKTGTSINQIINEKQEYTLIFKADKCTSAMNLIYKDKNLEYYTECYSLDDIYVNWSNAKIDSLKECLDNKKIDIKSLKEHGLEIEVVETYEN